MLTKTFQHEACWQVDPLQLPAYIKSTKYYGHKLGSTGAWLVLKQRLIDFGIAKPGAKAKLAKYLHVSQSQITKWFNNSSEKRTEPSYSVGKRIEHYLEIRPAKILHNKVLILEKLKNPKGTGK